MSVYLITSNDVNLGEYQAETAQAAIDACARDAGYTSEADVIAQFGRSGAQALEIDVDALCKAAGDYFGAAVFQDAYGSGIALIDGMTFDNYTQLAEAIKRRVWEFKA